MNLGLSYSAFPDCGRGDHMEKPRVQAFANRYVAELIENAPPNEIDLASAVVSKMDREAVYRVLRQIRERLLTEAELLDAL